MQRTSPDTQHIGSRSISAADERLAIVLYTCSGNYRPDRVQTTGTPPDRALQCRLLMFAAGVNGPTETINGTTRVPRHRQPARTGAVLSVK